MRPRNESDYRTLFWAFVLFPLLPAAAYHTPALSLGLLPITVYLSYCAGVLTHNHTHYPVFAGRRENAVYGAWLSIFYGCPVAFWVPTHLLNHHRFVNGARDVTRTHRLSGRHSLKNAIAYTLACGAWQWPLIAGYVRRARQQKSQRWVELRTQIAALTLAHAGMWALAVGLHGIGLGSLTYGLTFGLPALMAPSWMMFTNYIQHVHCEQGSEHNHSRNFTQPLANWFVFDAGYHSVHHEHPGVHWSRYAGLHRERKSLIDERLNASSVLRFCIENYLLGQFSERFRTREPQSPRVLPRPAERLGSRSAGSPRPREVV
jgi:beta-carotene hydroxylase